MIALFERLLLRAIEAVCIALLLALTGAVIYSTTMRYLGASPSWYDELASVMLAWLTYFGATYAVFMRHHMSFSGLVTAMPRGLAVALTAFSELLVIAFFNLQRNFPNAIWPKDESLEKEEEERDEEEKAEAEANGEDAVRRIN